MGRGGGCGSSKAVPVQQPMAKTEPTAQLNVQSDPPHETRALNVNTAGVDPVLVPQSDENVADNTPLSEEASRNAHNAPNAASDVDNKGIPLNADSEAVPFTTSISNASVHAAVMIQRWYRRYAAKMELRRKCSWQIFTNIEFQNENDQMALNDFFEDLDVLKEALDEETSHQSRNQDGTCPRSIKKRLNNIFAAQSVMSIETEKLLFNRPNKPSGLSTKVLRNLISGVRDGHCVAAQLLMSILDESFSLQKTFSNIRSMSTNVHHKVVVVGDLHGQLDDLLAIFEKNGIPSDTNPYVFNGDIVDRGRHGVELLAIILGFQLVYPHSVFCNRGNHEDYLMNKRYGFEKEVMIKYRDKAPMLLRAFGALFSALPLATIIDKKVFVVHGGVSDTTDLLALSNIQRQHFVSILRAVKAPTRPQDETDHVVNAVWSDPGNALGCTRNRTRGGGSFWGRDVTSAFLEKYDLSLIVRSHECQEKGFSWKHDNKVLTVFSASNYYAPGSNQGAFARFTSGQSRPDIIQFDATTDSGGSVTLQEEVGVLERAALSDLASKIYSLRDELQMAFRACDKEDSGVLTVGQWARCMEQVTKLSIPWRLIKEDLMNCPDDGRIDYREFQQSVTVVSSKAADDADGSKGSGVAEKLYKNIGALDYIFRLIDIDNSGKISHEEFVVAYKTLNKYLGHDFYEDAAYDIAKAVDLDKNGEIEFNEFVETFRLVRLHNS